MSNLESGNGDESAAQSVAKALKICFSLLVVALIAAILYYISESFFKVKESQQGIVLRFGKIMQKDGQATRGKGLTLTLPYPIHEKILIDTGRPQNVEMANFWLSSLLKDDKGEDITPPILTPGIDGYHLTSEGFIMHSKWTVRYTINNAVAYSERFYDSSQPRGQENRMNEVIGMLLQRGVTRASAGLNMETVWKDVNKDFVESVRKIVQADLDELQTGVRIETIFTEVAAPRQAQASFEAVTRAEEETSRNLAETEGQASRLLSQARVEESSQISSANAEKLTKVSKIAAEMEVFNKLYPEYKKDPEQFMKLYYQNRIQEIIAQVDDKIIVDKKNQRELRIDLKTPTTRKGEKSQ